MPRRDDVHKVLIIGSGPIIIGQACEFDYSGTQACKALRKLGYEIVLVNSNPATIMTDPVMADETYIEPLNVETLTEIIATAKPDALLPNLGGQTGLNLSSALEKTGVLEKYGVKIIGVGAGAIERGEDRLAFKETMDRLGIEMPASTTVTSVEDAEEIAADLGYPVVIRPAYTMGGTGGGLVYNVEELRIVAARGIQASLVGQILVEETVLGWEELELEVVRDAKNQMITVCFIENVDAMGVHTGDSYCTAPMLTITPELQARLQKYSYDIVEAIEVIGGTNVQFAHDPVTDRVVVIEINPRTSRSSALASKATGFPIAMVSLDARRRPDDGRDAVLARRHAREVHAVGRLRRREVRALGVREVPGLDRQARHADARRGRGHVHRQALQGVAAEGDPLARERAHGARLREGLPRAHARGAHGPARRAVERAPVRHVRGASQGRRHRRPSPSGRFIKRWFIEQMAELVALEEEILEFRGVARLPARRAARPREEGRLRRRVPREAPRPARERDPRATHRSRREARVRAGARERRGERRLLLLDLQRRRRRASERPPQDHGPRRRARTASARASSSTTAACTPRTRFATRASRRSW